MIFCKHYTTLIGLLLSITGLTQPISSKSSNVYVKVYGAYGFWAPGSTKGSPVLSTEPVRFNVVKKGMGGGIRAGLGLGVILNDFINLGIDGEYLKGNKILDKEIITAAESKAYHASGYSLEAERTLTHEVISIIPNIVFKAISTQSYYIYNRLGIVIGFPLDMKENFYQHYNYHNSAADNYAIEDRDIIITYTGKHKLKIGVGYQISIGVQTSISEKLRGFAELTAYNISFDRISYDDIERIGKTTEKNKAENTQPTVYDHSRYNYRYTSNGATGTIVRGVPFNQTTTITNAQQPIIMNAITIGAGLAYRF